MLTRSVFTKIVSIPPERCGTGIFCWCRRFFPIGRGGDFSSAPVTNNHCGVFKVAVAVYPPVTLFSIRPRRPELATSGRGRFAAIGRANEADLDRRRGAEWAGSQDIHGPAGGDVTALVRRFDLKFNRLNRTNPDAASAIRACDVKGEE
jgi:hypothetical protein